MRFIHLCFALLLLSACNTTASESYVFHPPENPGGRLCTTQCRSAQDFCEQACDLDNRACYGKLQEQAVLDYDKYVREQFAAHEAVELHAHDFERGGSCDSDKKECYNKCSGRYRSCYRDCGGDITTTTSCTFMCF